MLGNILLFTAIVILVLGVIVVSWAISKFNDFKRLETKVDESLSNIEVALEKRYDMLTKLRDSAKAYLAHERDLFAKVVELRHGMSLPELRAAETAIDAFRDRLLAVAENYPELKSSELFIGLQQGIRDSEEHLQAARRLFNANVSTYNQTIIVFPASVIAGLENRHAKEFLEAPEHKRQDVKMEF
jgi:LemA protein